MARSVGQIRSEITRRLEGCSRGVLGMWAKVEQISEGSDRPGYVRREGRPLTELQLARELQATRNAVAASLAALQGLGLLEKDDDGLFSPQLVRIAEVRRNGARRQAAYEARRKGAPGVSGRVSDRVSDDTVSGCHLTPILTPSTVSDDTRKVSDRVSDGVSDDTPASPSSSPPDGFSLLKPLSSLSPSPTTPTFGARATGAGVRALQEGANGGNPGRFPLSLGELDSTEGQRSAAREAFDRWSRAARGRELCEANNEHLPIHGLVESLDAAPGIRDESGELRSPRDLVARAVTEAMRRGEGWGNGTGSIRYAVRVVANFLHTWKAAGAVPRNGVHHSPHHGTHHAADNETGPPPPQDPEALAKAEAERLRLAAQRVRV